MSIAKDIVEGIAFALWAEALAGYTMEHERDGHRAPSGKWSDAYDELIYGDGEPPEAAMDPAMELANLYTLANGMSLEAMYARAPRGIVDSARDPKDDEYAELDPFQYGHALGTNALNTAGPKLDVESVTFEITFTGERLVWTGEIKPTTNPAKCDEVLREAWGSNTTIVIERGDHGYSAWLESAAGGRLPISFGTDNPSNAREALDSAKRFLRRVHGRNNPAGGDNFPTTPPPSGTATNATCTWIRPHRVWAWSTADAGPGAVMVKEPGYVAWNCPATHVYLDVNTTDADARATKIWREADAHQIGDHVSAFDEPNDEDFDGVIVDKVRPSGRPPHYIVRDGSGRDRRVPFGFVRERERMNPAGGGPARGGERSRFRETMRGHGRSTVVHRRKPSGNWIGDRDPEIQRLIAEKRGRATIGPKKRR